MKLIYICNEFPPRPHGGIGTFVETLSHGMRERGHQVAVVGLGDRHSRENLDGVEVTTLPKGRGPLIGNILSRWRLFRHLLRESRAGRADIIETPDHMGMLPLPIPGCLSLVRLHLADTVIKKHSRENSGLGAIRFFEWLTLRNHRHWIAVSKFVLEETQAVFKLRPENPEIIHNPLPPMPEAPPEIPRLPGKFVLYASALSERKGALVLAEAMKPLMEEDPDLSLVYAGWPMPHHGRPADEIIKSILGPDLAPRVHFLGRVERAVVIECMRRARVFAFPSRLEALGIVLLEAMAARVPIVAGSWPPIPEVIDDGVTGLLAGPDAPEELTGAIRRLLTEPAFAAETVERAERMVHARFNLRSCLDRSEACYSRILSAGPAEAAGALADGP